MDFNSLRDLERLEEQIFSYKPNIKSAEQKQTIRNRLRNQILESKAVVKIQRIDSECESLIISLKQRLMLLQDILIPKDKEIISPTFEGLLKNEDEVKLNLSSNSSDDESLSTLLPKIRVEQQKFKICQKVESREVQQAYTSTLPDSYLPLALRKNSRQRKLSYKKSHSSSASTTHSKSNCIKSHNKQEQTVTTSDVTFHSEQMTVAQQEVDTTPTLHIKIPSLHRGNVHYIILDSLDFARKVFDYRANEIKQHQQQRKSISQNSKVSKSHKKQLKCSSAPILENLNQHQQDLELSQLIQDVMAESCVDETLQATSALENINKNLGGDYAPVANENVITYSQSSQELSYSQNSNEFVDMVCSTSESDNLRKKSRKNTKRTNEQQLKEPPKKRGRKPRKKSATNSAQLQPQPPTKSNLAKYVEFFSNDCELLPGSSTPAASSTRSQPLVSSTTHNFEIVDQGQQQREQTSQQPITYYIDGDWANGGLCQLVPTNSVSVDGKELNQDDANPPFQDFVNYIDNSGCSGSNVSASDLEPNNSLPISIPLTIANLGFQNKNYNQASPQQIHHQPTVQNSLVPIINIQIPTLPNNIVGSFEPPPAHSHKQVIDLSFKSKTSLDISTDEAFNFTHNSNNLETFRFNKDDNCLPLDLSAKSDSVNEKVSENNSVTINTQDEDFIRSLIEQSDFDYSPEELKKGGGGESLAYYQDNKSFKAALDMPLLDFDTIELAQLVDDTTNASNEQGKSLTDENVCNDSANNENSNDVSMIAVNSSIGNNLHISDQSATEIFNKLLDICPENQFINDMRSGFTVNDDLNESVFGQCRVQNSTMCEVENSTSQLEKGGKEICNATSEKYDQEIENNSSSTSAAVPLNSSINTTDMIIDTPLNFNISDDGSSELRNDKVINFKNSTIDVNNEMCNNTQQSPVEDKEGIEVEAATTIYTNYQISNEVEIGNSKRIMECNEIKVDYNDKSLLNALKKDKENPLADGNSKSILKTNKKDLYVNDNSPKTNLKKDVIFTPTEKKHNHVGNFKNNITYKNDKMLCNEKDSSSLSLDNSESLQTFASVKSKPNEENVVFSVAKITLSEDDNLYATDSDASSGKSCESNEIKKMDTAVNINKQLLVSSNDIENLTQCYNIDHANSSGTLLPRSTVTDKASSLGNDNANSGPIVEQSVEDTTVMETKNTCGDSCAKELNLSATFKDHCKIDKDYLNIHNNKLKEPPNIKNNNQEEHCDISLERTKVTTVKLGVEDIFNLKDSNHTNEKLTLLELESKLDGSLDFDEDFDDALSLATSCFDSPIDERFEDSVSIDTTTKTNTSQDNQDDNCPYPQQIKHFKIPKISNSTDAVSSSNNSEEIKLGKSIPTNSVTKTTLTKSAENISKTVKNDLVQLNTTAEVMLAGTDLENGTTVLQKIAHTVFGISCLSYLVDKCYVITHCQLSHELNDTNKVYQNLNTLNKTEVNLAYQFLYNHSKLFKIYFEVFSTYYSTKKDRLKLLNMANDCERYPEYADFIISIYEALVKCGLSRVNACRLLLKRIREKSIATSIVEALVAIIMKSDWTMFTDFIEKYTQDTYKFNFRIDTLELMAPAVLNSKGCHLKQVFGKCVQTLHCDDMGLLLNSPSLIQCVALLTTNTQ